MADGNLRFAELPEMTEAPASEDFFKVLNTSQTSGDNSDANGQVQKISPANAFALARIVGSTYSTIQHMQDTLHSAGWLSGGGITDDADGTITVAAGTGLIRATDGAVAQLLFTDWAAEAGANVNLADNDISYIYVEYNSGSPRVIATTTERTDFNTNILLAVIGREGTDLHINEADRHIVGDHSNSMIRRLKETLPFAHTSGGIISETGTQNFALTAGVFWQGLTEFATAAFDSAVAGTFSYYYLSAPSVWTEQAAETDINNTQYNNGTSGLGTLSNNKYGVHWVYMATDDHIVVLFGQGDYTLEEAVDAQPPASVPQQVEVHGFLAGKIIIQKSATSFTEIESAFQVTFQGSLAADHGGLTGLSDPNDHPQHALIDGSRSCPNVTKQITQSSHPLVAGNTLYLKSDGLYTVANADNVAATSFVVGICKSDDDTNLFTMIQSGHYTGAGVPAGDPGDAIYQSLTNGLMTVTAPSAEGEYQILLGEIDVSATSMWVNIQLPIVIGSAVVLESDYSGVQTILARGAGATPAALTVNEQTVVGRTTGNNVEAVAMSGADASLVSGTAGAANRTAKWNSGGDAVQGGWDEKEKAVGIENPTGSETDIPFFKTKRAITISDIYAVVVGSTPSVTWTIRHHTDRSNVGNEVVTGGTTTTSTTTGDSISSFNDATIPAGSFIWIETTAKSGTVDTLEITIIYTAD